MSGAAFVGSLLSDFILSQNRFIVRLNNIRPERERRGDKGHKKTSC